MLKPEALMAIQQGLSINLLDRIIASARAAKMLTSSWLFLTLTQDELHLLYAREIAQGVMSPQRLDSLTRWPTAHLILTGPHARMVSTVIKGRVSCRGGSTCYVHYLPKSGGITLPAIVHQCPAEELPVKQWDYGCGVRRELSDAGVVTPQVDVGNDTTWNMIHSTATKDTYTPAWVRRINGLPKGRFRPFEGLPIIPDFRTP